MRAWVLEPERREVLEKDISSQTSVEVVFIPGLSDDSSQRNRREEDHELVPERAENRAGSYSLPSVLCLKEVHDEHHHEQHPDGCQQEGLGHWQGGSPYR